MSNSDPVPPAGRRGFWAFWTTLPGILTGVAAVVTAAVGLITLLNTLNADMSRAVSSRPDSAATSITPPSPVVSTTESSSLPGGVLAEGNITMKSPDLADLEKGLVGSSISGGDLYLYCSGGRCLLNAMSGQLTTAGKAGTKSECTAALSSRQEQALDPSRLSKGQTLCVQTDDGHIAALRILGLPGPGTAEFAFSYTLWQ